LQPDCEAAVSGGWGVEEKPLIAKGLTHDGHVLLPFA
jgi:hypothetical protein